MANNTTNTGDISSDEAANTETYWPSFEPQASTSYDINDVHSDSGSEYELPLHSRNYDAPGGVSPSLLYRENIPARVRRWGSGLILAERPSTPGSSSDRENINPVTMEEHINRPYLEGDIIIPFWENSPFTARDWPSTQDDSSSRSSFRIFEDETATNREIDFFEDENERASSDNDEYIWDSSLFSVSFSSEYLDEPGWDSVSDGPEHGDDEFPPFDHMELYSPKDEAALEKIDKLSSSEAVDELQNRLADYPWQAINNNILKENLVYDTIYYNKLWEWERLLDFREGERILNVKEVKETLAFMKLFETMEYVGGSGFTVLQTPSEENFEDDSIPERYFLSEDIIVDITVQEPRILDSEDHDDLVDPSIDDHGPMAFLAHNI